MTRVRTRFAPSPTGSLHIGGLRTALYSYAQAKHLGGRFILRIEDTDIKREVGGAKEKIYEILKKFGLEWDEGPLKGGPHEPYIQSERVKTGIYQKVAEKLVAEGHAFYCQCKPKNAKEEGYSKKLRDPCRDKGKTSGAIKLKIPDNEKISFKDFVLEKEVSWDTNTVADTTLLKSDGFPTYHLAVVVDDHEMEITYALRGHDWMPSTPIHLLVYKYLGYELPEIGHLTDILDPEGGKLSKRKGSTTCEGLLSDGYLPEAILNFVMLLGWAPKDDREFFNLEEFVKVFDSAGFQKSNPVFNREKLDWFNGYYIRQKTEQELQELLKPFIPSETDEEKVKKTIPLIKERISKLSDYWHLAGFFFEKREVDKKLFGESYKEHLGAALEVLKNIDEWNLKNLEIFLLELVDRKKFHRGNLFMDLRVAIAGSRFTPPINDSIVILGKDETLNRISKILSNN